MKVTEVAQVLNNLAGKFEELSKAAPEIREAMQHLNAKVKEGALDPSHVDAIRRGLFTDRMTGHVMGNHAAYEDFELSPHASQGVHIRMDGNDFGSINKKHGFETGNEAIKQFGSAIREAANESVGQSKSKLFRIGGDEFHLHVPDHQAAIRFAHTVRRKLNGLAPIGGTHRLSMSMGFGHNPAAAESALEHYAKADKKKMNYLPGQAQFHAHSLVPGKEGRVPMEDSQLPLAVG